jgi:hypothetical protein
MAEKSRRSRIHQIQENLRQARIDLEATRRQMNKFKNSEPNEIRGEEISDTYQRLERRISPENEAEE